MRYSIGLVVWEGEPLAFTFWSLGLLQIYLDYCLLHKTQTKPHPTWISCLPLFTLTSIQSSLIKA